MAEKAKERKKNLCQEVKDRDRVFRAGMKGEAEMSWTSVKDRSRKVQEPRERRSRKGLEAERVRLTSQGLQGTSRKLAGRRASLLDNSLASGRIARQ